MPVAPLKTWLVIVSLSLPCLAVSAQDFAVPEPLRPWVNWVLHDDDQARCPSSLGKKSDKSDKAAPRCAWPGRLTISADDKSATFRQAWTLLADGPVPLPGQPGLWPVAVQANGEAVPVVSEQGTPVVRLARGDIVLTGRFEFAVPPDYIQLPELAGLVSISVAGKTAEIGAGKAATPADIDSGGRLWLSRRTARDAAATPASRVSVELFTRIDDTVPLRLTQRLELDVSGRARELLLPSLAPAGFVPLNLRSPLPAQLDNDGGLRLQVRPGRHTVELELRSRAPLETLERLPLPEPLPESGLLSFAARPSLRTVTVEGLLAVDPTQTRLPAEWRELPTYRFASGDSLRLVERQRGDIGAEPDALKLSRLVWMDFDGRGYTVRDQFSGDLRSGWRLDAGDDLAIGRVTVDKQPRLVTRLAGGSADGVELRRGPLELRAESRVESAPDELSAVGWRTDVQQLDATLVLPPGWRLFMARGVDQTSNSWLTRWTLLDLFVVLIGAAAAVRLWGWTTGLLALALLALTFHEAGAPRWVWLNVIAAAALLRVLPVGKLRSLVSVYRVGALVALVVIGVPFAAQQVSLAVFPQLERGRAESSESSSTLDMFTQPEGVVFAKRSERDQELLAQADQATGAPARTPASKAARSAPRRLQSYDPNARLQTGPGLPSWNWTRVQLRWSGPVAADERVQLIYLRPLAVSLLRGLAVLLLGVLVLRVLDLRGKRPGLPAPGSAAAVLLAVLALGSMVHSPIAQADAMPSQGLLDSLRERLLEPPECAPHCAASPGLRIEVSERELRLAFEVHAQAEVAVPLPGASLAWQPDRVLVNGESAAEVLRDRDGRLLLRLPAGVHLVLLSGPMPAVASLALPLPLRPQRVIVTASEGMSVRGLRERGQVGDQVFVERSVASAQGEKEQRISVVGKPALPPFLEVTRTFTLGLDWRIDTQVRRLSSADGAAVVAVPLFPGESVLSENVEITNTETNSAEVLVNLAPGQGSMTWSSTLPISTELALAATSRPALTEVWTLQAAPVWHVEREGIAPVFAQRSGRTVQWRPWPGEQVALVISRPAAAPGPTLTAQSVVLNVSPGSRATTVSLRLGLLTSQGVEHAITIPTAAVLGRVSVDERELPVRREGDQVIVPLTPGAHRVELQWREPRGIETPSYVTPVVDIGVAAVNTSIEVNAPADRWVLWVRGPLLGPAVLFWGMIIVLVILAPVLARGRLTPLGVLGWFGLGIGLTQVPVPAAIFVAAWLFGLSFRGRGKAGSLGTTTFNLMQIALAVATVVALGVICWAIAGGLLGSPTMQVGGNGSYAGNLRWFVDRGPAVLPTTQVLSVPMLAYRLAMLLWALWVAASLLRWLGWGWRQFTSGGYWRTITWKSMSKLRGDQPPEATAR